MVRKVKDFFSRKERKLLTDVEEIGYFASPAGLSCKERRFASAGRKDRDGGLCLFPIRICGPADLRRTLGRPGMKGRNLSSRVIRDDQTLCGISIAENADAVGANAFSAEMLKVIAAVAADSAPNQGSPPMRFMATAMLPAQPPKSRRMARVRNVVLNPGSTGRVICSPKAPAKEKTAS